MWQTYMVSLCCSAFVASAQVSVANNLINSLGPPCPANAEEATTGDHFSLSIAGCPTIAIKDHSIVSHVGHMMCRCQPGYECINCGDCLVNETPIFVPGPGLASCHLSYRAGEESSHVAGKVAGGAIGAAAVIAAALGSFMYYRRRQDNSEQGNTEHSRAPLNSSEPSLGPFNTYGRAQYGTAAPAKVVPQQGPSHRQEADEGGSDDELIEISDNEGDMHSASARRNAGKRKAKSRRTSQIV